MAYGRNASARTDNSLRQKCLSQKILVSGYDGPGLSIATSSLAAMSVFNSSSSACAHHIPCGESIHMVKRVIVRDGIYVGFVSLIAMFRADVPLDQGISVLWRVSSTLCIKNPPLKNSLCNSDFPGPDRRLIGPVGTKSFCFKLREIRHVLDAFLPKLEAFVEHHIGSLFCPRGREITEHFHPKILIQAFLRRWEEEVNSNHIQCEADK